MRLPLIIPDYLLVLSNSHATIVATGTIVAGRDTPAKVGCKAVEEKLRLCTKRRPVLDCECTAAYSQRLPHNPRAKVMVRLHTLAGAHSNGQLGFGNHPSLPPTNHNK